MPRCETQKNDRKENKTKNTRHITRSALDQHEISTRSALETLRVSDTSSRIFEIKKKIKRTHHISQSRKQQQAITNTNNKQNNKNTTNNNNNYSTREPHMRAGPKGGVSSVLEMI